ncbi:peptide chain release factor N(5)-glutamine methyltransferase [bacterium]|nr:peptide chain release factor N(5)-glutamine methyltransferase [bacterium]
MLKLEKKSKASKLKKWLFWGEKKLKNKSKTPSLDTLLLLAFVLKKPKEFILAHSDLSLKPHFEIKFKNLIRKRQKHIPLAYLIKRKEFFGYSFYVDKKVLIPRPETEKIVEKTLNFIIQRSRKQWKILDLGTGSGCIAIALAKELEKRRIKFQIIASDISTKAIKVAKINAQKNQTEIRFIKSNLFEAINDKFDLILANLPYLKKVEIKNELKFEPKLALQDKGQIEKLLKDAKKYLNPKGAVFYETVQGIIKIYRP